MAPLNDNAGGEDKRPRGGKKALMDTSAPETPPACATPLTVSEETLRLAADAADIGFWDLDLTTNVLTWSDRVKAAFGISPDVACSMDDFYAGLHPDDYAATAAAFASALDPEQRATYDVEYRTIGKEDRVVRWVAARGRGIFDADGRCVRAIGTAIDITDKRATEARLRTLSADLERQVAERTLALGRTWQLSPYLMGVLNADGIFEASNPACQSVLGWSETELGQKSWRELVHPDDLASSEDNWINTVGLGLPVINVENRYRAKSGAWRWLSWVAIPESGKVYFTARDITEQKEQAKALARREAERDLLWRNSQDLLIIANTEGVFQDVSAAVTRLLGWRPDEIIGHSAFDFIHPEDVTSTLEAHTKATRGDLPPFVNRFRHKDGSYRWFSWVAAPGGGLVFATARHITLEREQAKALAEAQEALRQAQKIEAIGQLTGGIAHDFNNMLQGITGGIMLARMRLPPDAPVMKFLDLAITAANRAAALTSRLLAFGRRQPLDAKLVNLDDLVGNLQDLLQRTVGPEIQVSIHLQDGCWPVRCDPNQLESALLNLAINARDAMPNGGSVLIETEHVALNPADTAAWEGAEPGDYVRVCVADTGCGMPPDVLEHAFEPFFTTKPDGQGTGLGLSQLYGFIRQSQGVVRLESQVGKGTSVHLYLPRSSSDEPEIPAPSGDQEAAHTATEHGGAATVLLVEDEGTVRAAAAEALRQAGFTVIEAKDGHDGLNILRQVFDRKKGQRLDLLVADIGLPGGLNGRQLADAARSIAADLPILLITGYAGGALHGHGQLERGMALLVKPFELSALTERVRRLLKAVPRQPDA